jgi:signal transduction histidine kinase
MKLLTKTTLFFLTIALFILFGGGIIYYFSFRYVINQEVNRELITEMHQLIMAPAKSAISADTAAINSLIDYHIVPIKKASNQKFVFSDTMLYDKILSRYQPFRILSYETNLNGTPVRIMISKSLLFSDQLIEFVVFGTLLLSLFLLGCIVLLNNFFFTRIWGNFFHTIDVIKDYNISSTKDISFEESEITEFNMLNNVFEKMHGRIKKDYQNLKEFIENISHEIQNPLAIINSRIELLQQNENIDKSQADMIQSIHGSAIRLSNLNKSLILLSKIDNNQFTEKEKVDIQKLINLHIENFEDLINSKSILLTKNYRDSITVAADPNLISIMLLNLLKNSVFHNVPSGTIEILTEANSITIKNTGKKLDISEEDLFKRFTKSSARPDSLGLGLSIVKKICDYYRFSIQYSYTNNLHVVSINFT